MLLELCIWAYMLLVYVFILYFLKKYDEVRDPPLRTLRAGQTLASSVAGTSCSVPRHDRTPTYRVTITTSPVSYGQGTPGLLLVWCHVIAEHTVRMGARGIMRAAKRHPHRALPLSLWRRVLAAATGPAHAESYRSCMRSLVEFCQLDRSFCSAQRCVMWRCTG
jgi:hypothetical protein